MMPESGPCGWERSKGDREVRFIFLNLKCGDCLGWKSYLKKKITHLGAHFVVHDDNDAGKCDSRCVVKSYGRQGYAAPRGRRSCSCLFTSLSLYSRLT